MSKKNGACCYHTDTPTEQIGVYHMSDFQDEAAGENSLDALSASRLIAERLTLNDIHGCLYNPVEDESGCLVSVDDAYFSLRFNSAEDGEKMRERCGLVQCDGVPHFTESNRPNGWRYFYTYQIGQSTVRFGIGWIGSNGKTSMQRGFLQFNPNKTMNDERLGMLTRRIMTYLRDFKLERWDLAIDIPSCREDTRIAKDARGYEYIDKGHGITEYLGTRNKPGRVKLYDKTREAGLDGDWTRLELTCDGDWGIDEIMRRLPRVYTWRGSANESERNWVRAFGLLAAEYLDAVGGTIEPYLRLLGRGAARKVLDYLASPRVTVNRETLEDLMIRVSEVECMLCAI